MLSKTLSQVITIVNMYPKSADIIHSVVGHYIKKVDRAVDGQAQIKFNGWERDFIKRFANKYIEEGELENGNR